MWLLLPVAIVAALVVGWRVWVRVNAPVVTDIRLFEVRRMSFPITLSEKGELKAHKSVEVRCEMDGETSIVWIVPEGTMVKKGDLLVELAAEVVQEKVRAQQVEVNTAESKLEEATAMHGIQLGTNESEIAKAKTLLELAQIDLNKWENGDWPQQEQAAILAEQTMKSHLVQAQAAFVVSETARAANIIFDVELEAHRIFRQEAEAAYDNARMNLKVLREYTREKDFKTYLSAVRDAKDELTRAKAKAELERKKAVSAVARAEADLKLKKNELKMRQEQAGKAKMFATQPGLVAYHVPDYWRNEGPIDVGTKVRRNQKIINLPDLSSMKVEVQIHEADAERVDVGLPAKIEVSGISAAANDGAVNASQPSGVASQPSVNASQPSGIASQPSVNASQPSGVASQPSMPASGSAVAATQPTSTPKVFKGRVTKIAALASSADRWMNPELRQFKTEITLDESHPRLKPGMTAKVEIFVGQVTDVLAVPVQAVYTQGGKSYVFLEPSGGIPVYREVQLGVSSTTHVVVISGVSAGEKVWATLDESMLAALPQVSAEEPEADAPPQRP